VGRETNGFKVGDRAPSLDTIVGKVDWKNSTMVTSHLHRAR
jgi:hypothetical protein